MLIILLNRWLLWGVAEVRHETQHENCVQCKTDYLTGIEKLLATL